MLPIAPVMDRDPQAHSQLGIHCDNWEGEIPSPPARQRCQAGILTSDTGIFPAPVEPPEPRRYFYPALAVAGEGRGFPALLSLGLPGFIWENRGAPGPPGAERCWKSIPAWEAPVGSEPSMPWGRGSRAGAEMSRGDREGSSGPGRSRERGR